MQDIGSEEQGGDRLAKGYERLMQRARELLRDTEASDLPSLDELMHKATDAVVEVGDLTRIEAQRIATWLGDDLRDAAQHLREDGAVLREWLRFDIGLLETQLAERLSMLADHTREELERIDADAHAARMAHTGEVIGPGTLFCQECGQSVTLKGSSRVPPCAKCHATLFARAVRHQAS